MAASCFNCKKQVLVGKIICGECIERLNVSDGCSEGLGTDTETLDMSVDRVLTEERAGERLIKAFKEGRILVLPAPIGSEVFVPCVYEEEDGVIVAEVDTLILSGYINEDGREFYTTYDEEHCSCDVPPEDLFVDRAEAEARLAVLRREFEESKRGENEKSKTLD